MTIYYHYLLTNELKEDYNLTIKNTGLSRCGTSHWFKASIWGNLFHQELVVSLLAAAFHCRNAGKNMIILLFFCLPYLQLVHEISSHRDCWYSWTPKIQLFFLSLYWEMKKKPSPAEVLALGKHTVQNHSTHQFQIWCDSYFQIIFSKIPRDNDLSPGPLGIRSAPGTFLVERAKKLYQSHVLQKHFDIF